MTTWQMEYYTPDTGRIYFTVRAATFEEAVQKGDAIIRNLRRVGTYEKFS